MSYIPTNLASALKDPNARIHALRAQLPAPQANNPATLKSVTGIALKALPPSGKFAEALAALAVLHQKNKEIQARIQTVLQDRVRQEYQKLVNHASERIVAGDTAAMDDLETQKDIEARFEAERDALHKALGGVGRQELPHALVVAVEIDEALAALEAELGSHEAEQCRRFGIPPEASSWTRLVQSVRICFHRRALDLERLSNLKKTDLFSPFAQSMLGDFISTSA